MGAHTLPAEPQHTCPPVHSREARHLPAGALVPAAALTRSL